MQEAEIKAELDRLLPDAIAQNTLELIQVRMVLDAQAASTAENTRAVVENTVKAQSGGSKAASAASAAASSMLGGGILGPIVTGLIGLFGGGGGDTETPPPLVRFALPPALKVDAGVQGGVTGPVTYGQGGEVRVTPQQSAPAQQITVNVNAMDSRSFMDHSGEIADAVRRAMLESSALNDVIGEM